MIKNKNYFRQEGRIAANWFVAGFFTVIIVGLVAVFFIKKRIGFMEDSHSSANPMPDNISVVAGSGGQEIVQNETDHYTVAVPDSWYIEKSAGAGLAVYPNYDPASGLAPECKIEVFSFASASTTDLNAWLTNDLHADPTADISEISRTNLNIGSSSGLEWRGSFNGVMTTLVYVLAGGKVFEIAPSTLSDASDADNDFCDPALQEFLSNLQF